MTEGFHENDAENLEPARSDDNAAAPLLPSAEEPTASEGTGNEAVDRVVSSLGLLEGLPVNDHVAVFESAHEQLRAALSHAADADAGDDGDRS